MTDSSWGDPEVLNLSVTFPNQDREFPEIRSWKAHLGLPERAKSLEYPLVPRPGAGGWLGPPLHVLLCFRGCGLWLGSPGGLAALVAIEGQCPVYIVRCLSKRGAETQGWGRMEQNQD